MASFKYKSASSGSWLDVPPSAYQGTFAGSFDLVYPQATDYTIAGRVCAAIGLPYINLQSQIMSASGLNFWMSKFAASNFGDVEFWLSVYDAYNAGWRYYTGWLKRPTYQRVQVGSGSSNTIYYGVEIDLLQAASSASS
jgi:hypothetical protein